MGWQNSKSKKKSIYPSSKVKSGIIAPLIGIVQFIWLIDQYQYKTLGKFSSLESTTCLVWAMAFFLSVRLSLDPVLVFLFDLISHIFAINEFKYVAKKQKYMESSFWQCYSLIWNSAITFPVAIITLNILRKSLLNFDIVRFNALVLEVGGYISYIGIACATLIMFRQRRNVRRVLNMFIRLQGMNFKLVGRTASIPLKDVIICFIRNFISLYYRTPYFNRIHHISLCHCRTFVLYILVDIAMIVHFRLIQSLASQLESNRNCNGQKRIIYIDFFTKLVYLRQKIQTLNWPILLNKLVVEIIWTTQNCQGAYFTEVDMGINIMILVFEVYISNLIHVMYMAKNIDRLEKKIFDELYERELLEAIKHPERIRNLRLLKVSPLAYYIYLQYVYIYNLLYIAYSWINWLSMLYQWKKKQSAL